MTQSKTKSDLPNVNAKSFLMVIVNNDEHTEFFDRVEDDGHALDGVCVDDRLVHQPLLQRVVRLVDQPHLSENK